MNVVIRQTNEENTLKEVNIVIKYYNEDKKLDTDYICNKEFKLEKINNTEKTIDYKLIINNLHVYNNSSNNLNFIYYLRLIKKKNILINEELNTIAQITSKSLYVDKNNNNESCKEFYFNLNDLKIDEDYIAQLFIKIEKANEEEEKYYTLTYEIKQVAKEKKDDNTIFIIVIILIVVALFAALILSFFIWHKMRLKNRRLEDKVNAISFSNGISEELNNNKDSLKSNEEYENTFI